MEEIVESSVIIIRFPSCRFRIRVEHARKKKKKEYESRWKWTKSLNNEKYEMRGKQRNITGTGEQVQCFIVIPNGN